MPFRTSYFKETFTMVNLCLDFYNRLILMNQLSSESIVETISIRHHIDIGGTLALRASVTRV